MKLQFHISISNISFETYFLFLFDFMVKGNEKGRCFEFQRDCVGIHADTH